MCVCLAYLLSRSPIILEGHEGAVTCVQFDAKHIVSASCDRTIRIWDLHGGALLRTLTGHQGMGPHACKPAIAHTVFAAVAGETFTRDARTPSPYSRILQ